MLGLLQQPPESADAHAVYKGCQKHTTCRLVFMLALIQKLPKGGNANYIYIFLFFLKSFFLARLYLCNTFCNTCPKAAVS